MTKSTAVSATFSQIALAACALALAIPAAPALASPLDWVIGSKTRGNGMIERQNRQLGHFNAVSLNLPGSVEIRLGDTESITVESDANLQALIDTVVENGTLKIRQTKRLSNFNPTTLKFVVQAKSVERLSVGGSGSIDAANLRAPKLQFDVGGSGKIHVKQLESDAVAVALGGSGDFKASGTTKQLSLAIGGSGSVQASELAAKSVNVSIGGSGDAVVWAKQSLSASIGGSGDISYYGDPQLSTSVLGSGSVKRIGAAPN